MSTENNSNLGQQLEQLKAEQAQLVAKKEASKLTKVEQERLTALTGEIIDIETDGETQKSIGYEVPEGEEGVYHVLQWRGNAFDPNTGEEVSKNYVQKYNAGDFKNFETHARGLGYMYEVLHAPKK